MKVHHLNCGSIHPPLGPPAICHVLLVETPQGLVLVDTGFGNADIADPARRIGPLRHVIKPLLSPAETAARQITDLGFDVTDVRHIVATHLDFDHIGGAADFPQAQVHTTTAEAAAIYGRNVHARTRYRRAQLTAPPQVVTHERGGESWFDFSGVTPLDEIADGLALVPLPGHTAGHTGVAVDAGDHWILHCGDAFYHHRTLEGESAPWVLRCAELSFAMDPRSITRNHRLLATAHQRHGDKLRIICAHDPAQLPT